MTENVGPFGKRLGDRWREGNKKSKKTIWDRNCNEKIFQSLIAFQSREGFYGPVETDHY